MVLWHALIVFMTFPDIIYDVHWYSANFSFLFHIYAWLNILTGKDFLMMNADDCMMITDDCMTLPDNFYDEYW